MKKTICLILSLILLSANISVAAQQSYSQEDGYVIVDHVVYKSYDNDSYTVVDFFDSAEYALTAERINVSAEINGMPVDCIELRDKKYAPMVVSVNLPNSIKSIYATEYTGVFAGMKNLDSVTLPKNLKTIGEYAFRGSQGLKRIVIPEKVDYIGEYAFSGCTAIEKVEIKNRNYRFVSGGCFEGCVNLSELEVAGKLKEIGDFAFANCSKLEKFDLKTLDYIGSSAFSSTGFKNLTLPKNLADRVSDGAFEKCQYLKTVVIKGNKSKKIYLNRTFFGCPRLRRVVLPKYSKSVTIADNAFADCKNLREVVLQSKKRAFIFRHAVGEDPNVPCAQFKNTRAGIKFYVKDKKIARQLKKEITRKKGIGVRKAKIYAGKKLVYKNVSSNKR